MYTLKELVGARLTGAPAWEKIVPADWSMLQLYEQFRKIYAKLETAPDVPDVYLDLEKIAAEYSSDARTFPEVIAANGDNAWPVTSTSPFPEQKHCVFSDALRAGFKITPVHPQYGDGDTVMASQKTALRLTRAEPVTNYTDLHSYVLATVSGYTHLVDTNGTEGLIVYDGMTTSRRSDRYEVGLISFRQVGQLEHIPITSAMLHKRNTSQLYRHLAHIDLGRSIGDRAILLSLGGYLHYPDDGIVRRVSDKIISIDVQRIPILKRYYESYRELDLSSLQLEETLRNATQRDRAELLSDDVISKYFRLSQSFVVLLDAKDIYVTRRRVQNTKIANLFIAHEPPLHPFVQTLGRIPTYWSVHEDGQYALGVRANDVARHLHTTTATNELPNISDNRHGQALAELSTGYFVELGVGKITDLTTGPYIPEFPDPVYNLSASAATINEGGTVTFSLDAQYVAAGDSVPWTVTGIQSADVVGGALSGTMTFDVDGHAEATIILTVDLTTEGKQTMVFAAAGKTVSVDVNDTSTTPPATYALSSTSLNVNEGGSVTITLTTSNVAQGTAVGWTIAGLQSADLQSGLVSGDMVIGADGTASLTITLVEDLTTEGAETLTFSAAGESLVITVNDTSLTPVAGALTVTEESILTPSDPVASMAYGTSVAMSGDGSRIVVGSPSKWVGGIASFGATYIYQVSGGVPVERALLVPVVYSDADEFGRSVAISGDGSTVFASSHLADINGNGSAGAVTVYTSADGVTWTQQERLTADPGAVNDRMGYSVATSSDGNTAAFGAFVADSQGLTQSGAVYIFTRTGSTWTQQARLEAPVAYSGARFGTSVTLSGDGNTVAIGAPIDDLGTNNTGTVYIFTRTGSTWTHHTSLLAQPVETEGRYGTSVSLSRDGTTLIVGADYTSADGVEDAGVAAVYALTGGTWVRQAVLQSPTPAAYEYFGTSVSLSATGDIAVIGAPFYSATSSNQEGSVYYFKRDAGTWAFEQRVTASDAEAYARYGCAVAISDAGTAATIGAFRDDVGGSFDVGQAYIHDIVIG